MPLQFLYATDDTHETFGEYCVLDSGMTHFEHGEEYLVAVFPPQGGSYGQLVHIYLTSCPADFYRIVVFKSKDGSKSGYTLKTGSGGSMANLAKEIGLACRDSMLVIDLQTNKV